MGRPSSRRGSGFTAYLDELRTTQRYPIYRALKHPLYPILRKIERIEEGVGVARAATHLPVARSTSPITRVISITSIEPLVLDDNGVRPPVIAAGINLFGGPLGLLHRHVTGAIPIRRNTKDPAYLVTLKAYIAELLQRHDLMFYIEGGRSYSGEMKAPKTGLLHAAMQSGRTDVVILPMAIAYDLVLEDHVLAHQGAKRRQRPFGREIAEMVRYAVGYQSRAFVTFGKPIPLTGWTADARRDVMDLAHLVRDTIGRLHKVLPTAVVAAAMRPSIERRDLENRAEDVIGIVRAAGANLGVTSGREAVELGAPMLADRGIIHVERGSLFRVRERTVLRYYARTLQHLLTAQGEFHAPTDDRFGLQGDLPLPSPVVDASSPLPQVTGCASRGARQTIHRRRNDGRCDYPRARGRSPGDDADADYLGESVTSMAKADRMARACLGIIESIAAAGIGRNVS